MTAGAAPMVIGIAVCVILTAIPSAGLVAVFSRDAPPQLFLTTKGSVPSLQSSRASFDPPPGNVARTAASEAASPPAEYGGSLVYDLADEYELYYGGGTFQTPFSSTWIFSNGNWTNITLTAGTPPTPRQGMTMTFDASDGYVLAYGGLETGTSSSCSHGAACNDTWAFQGGKWRELNPTVNPICSSPFYGGPRDRLPAGGGAPMTYDSADGEVVMFDGEPPSSYASGQETWEYHADNWTELACSTSGGAVPPPTGGEQFVYDSALQEAILFGGASFTSGGWDQYDSTWAWSHGAWENISSSLPVHPSHRASYGLAYDSVGSELVLFGGVWTQAPSTEIYLNDTWTFDSRGWTNVTSSVAPQPRDSSAIYDDPLAGGVLLFGGFTNTNPETLGALGDTWSWSGVGDTWSLIYGSLTVSSILASPNPAIFGSPVVFNASVRWGTPPYTYSWAFGDGTTGGNLPEITHAYTTNGPFQVVLTVNDSVGDSARGLLNVTIQLQAQIHASATAGGPPLAVNFSGGAVGGVPPYYYTWNFGDGSPTSHAQNPDHTYNGSRVYTVVLTVVDDAGHQANLTLRVSTLGFLGLPYEEGYYVLAVAAVAILVVAVVVGRRAVSRKTSEVEREEQTDAFQEFRQGLDHPDGGPIDTVAPGETDPAEDLF